MQKDYHSTNLSRGHPETQHIAEHWTRVWEKYAERGGSKATVLKKEMYGLMLPFMRKLPKSAHILDGGCGMGEWTKRFSEEGFDVTGIDLSAPTVELLREKFPHLNFIQGDIRSLPFPDDMFDVYFSWGTFEHFEDGLGKPIEEALRVLKPGGLLFITVPFQNLRQKSSALHAW